MKAISLPSFALPTVIPRNSSSLFAPGLRKRRTDVNSVVRADEYRIRLSKLLPFQNDIAVLVEYLNASVLAVGDIHPLLRTADEDVVRLVEVARRWPLAAPLLDESPVLGELHHASIPGRIRLVAVADEGIAILSDSDAGRPIEHVSSATGDTHLAEHHQYLAVLIELENLLTQLNAVFVSGRHAQHHVVIVEIADPDASVRVVHGEGVRIGKHAHAETFAQLAGRIELQNRRICRAAVDAGRVARRHGVEAAMEHPDRAVLRDINANNLAPFAAVHCPGQRRPAVDELVGIGKIGWLVL